MASPAESRTRSARAMTPRARSSSITITALSPRASARSSASDREADTPTPSSPAHPGRPTRSRRPFTRPSSPYPGTAVTCCASAISRPRAASTIAAASGCSEERSSPAAAASSSASPVPSASTADTTNLPSVSVPVLSSATKRMLRPRSKASRLRTRIPLRAEMEVAFMLTSGMASPRACGQAITSTVTARATAKVAPSAPKISQASRVGTDTPTATMVSQ